MLTVTAINKAQAKEKQYRMPDERGLVLLVRPNGSKLWQLRFRHEGKEKTASLGKYPDVTLADARNRRDEQRKLIAAGADPVVAKREQAKAKAIAAANNFEAVARNWWEHWKAGRTSDHHVAQTLRRLEADVFPKIGIRPISEIEAPELVEMAKEIEKRGATELAKRSLQVCSMIFRYAIANGKLGATRLSTFDLVMY